jgi:PAS domain S-box-containing protein
MTRKPSYEELLLRVRELEAGAAAQRKDRAAAEHGDDGLLRNNEGHFRELVDNSPTGISIIQDEKIVYRNPEQQRIFGPLEPLTSMYVKIHPEDREKYHDMYQSALSGNAPHSGITLRFIHLCGETVGEQAIKWLHCRANLIKYQGRKAVLVNMMDVTKAREIERLLNIQDRMTSLGHVAAGIAHEIRNPLSGINIYLDTGISMLERGEDREKLREVLEKIQTASSKIESVIKRVMDFSRPSEPRLGPVDINTPVEDALGLSSVMLRKTAIELDTDLSEGLPRCIADSQLIEQVVLNLITNASEAMKDMGRGKKIQVSTSLKGDFITVSVSDSGPGVTTDLARKIFDPFFTTKNGSTGIGLSLCQRIIHDHGGILSVNSSRLGGAEFSFTIPAIKDREAE